MTGALTGVRVVDIGHHVAGPLTTVMLADQGAEVIRIDRPSPPGTASESEAFLHRGKRRITLDLKDDNDLAIARRIIERADILVENFRPGVMDRLGLGWQNLAKSAPGLVYCSLPGFGSDDPRANVPGWEGVIAAATGNCRVRHGEAPDGWDMSRPTYSALPLASSFAALLASYAIVAALVSRHQNGHGERIEVPLFNAMFELIGGAGAYIEERGPQPERPLVRGGSGTYRCSDGRYVQFNPIGASARFLRWFLDAAGQTSWAAEGLTSRTRIEADPAVAEDLRNRLRTLFLTRTAQEWEDLANDVGVPLCKIRSSAEWLANEHARQSGQVVRLDDPELGPTWMAGRMVTLSGGPAAPLQARHGRDADRDEVLAELDTEPPAAGATARRPKTGEPPFARMRVVDLTQILAGPSAGRMLAEFGADVVKINSPQRKIDVHGFVNRGKRSVLLDLESPDGQEVLWRLIDDADVVTVNFPPRTARRYGLSYQHLQARRPGIVYVSVSCYGEGGPWESRRGYETQGQAATGVMERAGRDGVPSADSRPGVLGPYNLLDYGTGVMAAFAAALGIYHRVTTGAGQQVSVSLTQTGAFHQSSLLLDHAEKTWDEPAGRYVQGSGPLQRFYQAEDGWFFLGATPEQWDTLLMIEGLTSIAVPSPDDLRLEAALEDVFRTSTVEHWTSILQAAGVGAHHAVALPELMTDPWVRSRGLSISAVSEEVGAVVMPGTAIRMERQSIAPGAPARQPGADGRDVLTSVGIAPDEIERLELGWTVQLRALPPGWEGF